MNDEPIWTAACARPIGIIETTGINGCNSIITLGNTTGRITFFIHIFSRTDFDPFRIRYFKQKSLKAAGLDILQFQRRVRTDFKLKEFLLWRRTDAP